MEATLQLTRGHLCTNTTETGDHKWCKALVILLPNLTSCNAHSEAPTPIRIVASAKDTTVLMVAHSDPSDRPSKERLERRFFTSLSRMQAFAVEGVRKQVRFVGAAMTRACPVRV